jgi:3-oxoacyl-[acyl-carrier protein] reductase
VRYPDLTGQVALVTGGSGGIGAATCRLLAANGVRIAVNGRDRPAIDAVVADIRAGGGIAEPAAGDVTDEQTVRDVRDRVERTLGLPGMVERESGSIITMSSAAGRQPGGANAAYAAAKAGVVMFTRHLAREVAAHHVRVNCLAPSAVLNDRMRRVMTAEQITGLAAGFPLGRIGRPLDVAQATAFLASDASSWMTGVTLDLAGGRVIM